MKSIKTGNPILTVLLLASCIPVSGSYMTEASLIWPLSTILYTFGLLVTFMSLPKGIGRIIIFNICATILFVIESCYFFSYYLQNAGFNDAFFYHLRPDLIFSGFNEHLKILIGIAICLLGYLTAAKITFANDRIKKAPIAAFLCLIIGLCLSPPAREIYLYLKNPIAGDTSILITENFNKPIETSTFINFTLEKRPNIILIYAESLEQTYFDETIFPELLPNLKRIKANSINFTDVSQGIGSGWTVAGIVASQCGYPLTGFQGFYQRYASTFGGFLPNTTCMGDLLKDDGYRLIFIGGANPRYAGKGDFLRSHGYDKIIGRKQLTELLMDKSYINDWGAFDDTLFQYARREFTRLSRERSPFLLTLLTLDTHHPTGFLSQSCGVYLDGDNSSLNSLHCSDRLIAEFIEDVRSSPYSENTMIIILSDHLAMRNQASSILKSSSEPRRLTFIVNTPDGNNRHYDSPGTHFDIAPTILNLVGYRVNDQLGLGLPLTQGPGYLPGKFGKDWQKLEHEIIMIGKALWQNRLQLDREGIDIDLNALAIRMAGKKINIDSGSNTKFPASTLILFDEQSLSLESIEIYPLDKYMTPISLVETLLINQDKLALVISRAKNLAGFANSNLNPNQWAIFFGRPSAKKFFAGPLSDPLKINFDIIDEVRRAEIDPKIVQERKNLLQKIKKYLSSINHLPLESGK